MVDLDSEHWRVSRRQGADVRTLVQGQMPEMNATEWHSFVLKRRTRWLSGVLGQRLLFRLYDTGSGTGQAASWAPEPEAIGAARFQAVSEDDMVLGDDFMRSPDEKAEGVWELVVGQWKLQSYADEWRGSSPLDPINTARNANPFVYRGTGAPRAVAVAGYPFWDDLSAAVSIRSQGGRAGWLFAYQSPDDHYALWWEPTSVWEQPCRLALERVRGGKRTVLAEANLPGQREQWYRLGVEVRGAQIVATLRDAPILRISDPTCLGGRFGMCAADGEVDFDDVSVRSSALRPLQEPWLRSHAEALPADAWTWLEHGVLCTLSRRAAEAHLKLPALGVEATKVAVTVELPEDGILQFGLFVGRSDQGAALFTWDADSRFRPKRQLILRTPRRDTAICKARGGFTPGQTLRLLIERTERELCVYELNAGLLLRTRDCGVTEAQLGFTVAGKGEVVFRDLLVDGPEERDWERPVKTQIFTKDYYMVGWSAAEGEWRRDESSSSAFPIWWHKGDFFGALELGIPLPAATARDGVRVFLLAPDNRPESSCQLSVAPARGGTGEKLLARLSWKGRTLAQEAFVPEDGAETLTLRRDGQFVWLQCGVDEPLFVQMDDRATRGTRLGVQLASPVILDALTLRRDHVVDDQFDEVATNWRKLGRWEVSNKFHCDPRWAYMVGESDGLAALWHLDSFPGDVTLEFYAGMRYRAKFDFMPYYPRPGDINAAICSSGAGVFDGYAAVVSGWHTTWTRLLRQGESVAETDQPLVPSTRRAYAKPQDLHRKWFYVKVRRIGSLLELYFENEKVLSWRDEDPLPGGRIGLWTVDNSILIARAKIAYSRRERFRPTPLGVSDAGATADKPADAPAPLRLDSKTHPGCRFTFDTPAHLAGWQETGDVGDARITWKPRTTEADDGGCLRAVNENPGGQFLVPVPSAGLNVRKAHRLAFDYRLDPGVKINLYASIAGKRFFIHLTGPDASDENIQCLGDASVRADGRWHRVEFPLGMALLDKRALDRQLRIEQMQFGVHRGQYLLAGLNGNAAGSAFELDNFEIYAEGSGPFSARLLDAGGSPRADGTVSIVAADGTAICKQEAFSGGTLDQTLPEGTYLIHAKAGDAAATLRVRVVTADLAVTSVAPAADEQWGGQPVTVQFGPGPMLPVWELTLRAAGRSFTPDGQVLTADAKARTLRFDPQAARLTFPEGQPVALDVRTKGLSGKTLKEWAPVYARALDKIAPLAVQVQEYLVHDTFEHDMGSWTRIGRDRKGREQGALLVRDHERAASGRYSLKLFNELIGGVAGAQVTARALNAGRYPLVSFDCLMDEEMVVDLLFTARGQQCRITLTDNAHNNTSYRLGGLAPRFAADGRWHHLEANWHDLIAQSPYVANMFTVSNVFFGDHGWMGNRQGGAYWIDNFRVAPCFSSAGSGFALRWTCTDTSAIGGYSYHWSAEPHEEADQTSEGSETTARFSALPEGKQYFHIRPLDSAGNWGDSTDWAFLLDNTAPAVTRTFPAADSASGERRLGVEFTDSISGLDPACLRLTVNGRTVVPGQTGVQVDLSAGEFSVDWVEARLATAPPPDGHVFDVVLAPLRDFAGNTAEPLKWRWTFGAAQDQQPPLSPVISCLDANAMHQYAFEQKGQTLSASAPVWVDRVLDTELGSHVQRTRVDGEGLALRVAVAGKIDTQTHRYFAFRYRFPPELKIDLTSRNADKDPEHLWLVMKLTDGDVRPDYVSHAGRVAGIACDDQWHAAIVDLQSHILQQEHLEQGQEPPTWELTNLCFYDIGFNWNKPGTVFYLDDVVLFAPGPAKARFRFSASDASGIKGFACSFDRMPDSEPEAAMTVKLGDLFETTFPDQGVWYVHARALDGAGNWSKTGHYAYVVR